MTATDAPRYLVYDVCKQANPSLVVAEWENMGHFREAADNCNAVIVDLVERRVYWNGEWKACDVHDWRGRE